MGIFFPIALFPPLLRLLALLFPPTWMTNGVRSALLGLNYFFQEWYLDLAVLWAFALITPLLGYWIFTRAETSIRRNEGVGVLTPGVGECPNAFFPNLQFIGFRSGFARRATVYELILMAAP
jgi:hypothetical protein